MVSLTLWIACIIIIFLYVDCTDYDVRLVGGQSPYEGTVEVCNYHSWGQVLDSGWGNKEAQVICNQLSYNNSGNEELSMYNNYCN